MRATCIGVIASVTSLHRSGVSAVEAIWRPTRFERAVSDRVAPRRQAAVAVETAASAEQH